MTDSGLSLVRVGSVAPLFVMRCIGTRKNMSLHTEPASVRTYADSGNDSVLVITVRAK